MSEEYHGEGGALPPHDPRHRVVAETLEFYSQEMNRMIEEKERMEALLALEKRKTRAAKCEAAVYRKRLKSLVLRSWINRSQNWDVPDDPKEVFLPWEVEREIEQELNARRLGLEMLHRLETFEDAVEELSEFGYTKASHVKPFGVYPPDEEPFKLWEVNEDVKAFAQETRDKAALVPEEAQAKNPRVEQMMMMDFDSLRNTDLS